MFFLPITIDALTTWRRRLCALNPQERRILRDTFFSADEKALLSRAYHRAVEALFVEDESIRLAMLRRLVDLGEEGICDHADFRLRVSPGHLGCVLAEELKFTRLASALGCLCHRPTLEAILEWPTLIWRVAFSASTK